MSTVPIVAGTAVDAENPWPGLSSFDETARRFFSGRDAESADLVRLVGQATLTVLFGKSGLGKTSLLQAGLFPRLRERNVLPVYVRLDVRDRSAPLIEQAAVALRSEVGKHGVDAIVPPAGESLWEHLHGRDVEWWSAKNQPLTPLFVFDQFEEVFTLGADNADAVERLRLDLADLIENRIPKSLGDRIEADASPEHLDLRGQRYKVLLSFREDFLPEVEGWKQELPSLMRNRLRLLPMSADPALQVVSGQTLSGRTHTLVSDETARDIVRFVAAVQVGADTTGRKRNVADPAWDTLEIEPALLSLVCAGLNERRKARGQAEIDAALLKETGESIIGDFYQRCVADVPEKTRRFIEDALITEGGFRNSYPLQDALDQGLLTAPMLRQLVDRRLLRVDHQLGTDRVELIHDRLTDVVRSRRDLERERVRARRLRRLLAAALLVFLAMGGAGVKFYLLWQDARRAEIVADTARRDAERSFIEIKRAFQVASVAQQEASNALESASRSAQEAKAALRDAIAGKMVLESRAVLDGQRGATPDVGLALAAAGFRLKPNNEAYSGLHHALRATAEIVRVVSVRGFPRALSPDGQTAVTLGNDGAMRLWDLRVGQVRGAPIRHARGSESGPPTVAFSPDGRMLASAGGDRTLRVWDGVTGAARQAFVQEGAQWAGLPSFSPDGTKLLFGLLVSNRETWNVLDRASGRPSPVSIGRAGVGSAFSPDGQTILASSDGKSLRLWDIATGEARGAPLEGESGAAKLVFSQDGKTVVAGGFNNSVRVWDVATGRRRHLLEGHTSSVVTVALSRDGETVASGGYDGSVRLWNAATGELRGAPLDVHAGLVYVVAFGRDGKTVISVNADATVRWWDNAPGRRRSDPLVGHEAGVLRVAFSPDGQTIVSGGFDRKVRLWDSVTGRPRGVLMDTIPDWVTGLAFSPDGQTIVTADRETIRRWDAVTGQSRGVFPTGHTDRVTGLVFSPDGRTLASASHDATVRIWDSVTGRPRAKLADGSSNKLTSLAFSPDATTIAAGDFKGRLHWWNVATGRPRADASPTAHERSVESIAFSPDGKTLVSASQDQTLRLWDVATGQSRAFGTNHLDWVTSVAFSPDGGTIVSGGIDGNLRLWDAASGQPRGTPLSGHTASVDAVAFSPDGKTIVSGSKDMTLRLWEAPVVWIDRVCAKLVRNLSLSEWKRYVGDLPYRPQCPGLPVPKDDTGAD